MDDRRIFPPEVIVQVKAMACELPVQSGLPVSRYSTSELTHEIIRRGIVAEISGTTVWRWLHEDAIKPYAISELDFPTRSLILSEGRQSVRSVSRDLERKAAHDARLRDFGR